MKLVKVKGVVIRETAYSDNDKIITLLTDSLGKISCMAKGAKKTNSPILASSQYLVYSEFVLYKGTSFYYINSADVINTFYDLRIDLDKLNVAFELTKILQTTTDENQDTSDVLKLFLNTLYVIEKLNKDLDLTKSIFKVKLLNLLGFYQPIDKCYICGKSMQAEDEIYYDYVTNTFVCSNCILNSDKRRYIKLSNTCVIAINYVARSGIKKVFSFELKQNALRQFMLYAQAYCDSITNGI